MICPGVISIGIPRPGVTGLSSELEVKEGGDGEHVGALEAMMGEAMEDEAEAVEAVVVIIRLLALEFKFVFAVFTSLVEVIGMTRVGVLLVTEVVAVTEVVVEAADARGRNAIIFFPPGPVITINCRPVACNEAAKAGGTIICLRIGLFCLRPLLLLFPAPFSSTSLRLET